MSARGSQTLPHGFRVMLGLQPRALFKLVHADATLGLPGKFATGFAATFHLRNQPGLLLSEPPAASPNAVRERG